jgi:uncharacterized coiled-coil DUF342 family protein
MPFELRDFQDLAQLLRDHPEWREELRALLLTQELLTLPTLVRDLTATVARLAERMDQLAMRQDQLTATVAHLAARMDQLTARMDQLTARMDQLTARMDQLAERMDQLTVRMDQLAERMDQLAARMDQLTERMDQLTARMDQLTERVDQLTVRMDQLTMRMDQLTVRVDQLAAHMDQLAATVARLAEGQQRLEVQMGEVRGWTLEQRYRTHAPAYFGRFLGQVQAVNLGRLADALRERLEEREVEEVLLSDLILTGRLHTPAKSSAIWVVLEVSTMVDRADVERAQRRATLLRQARYPAVAVAAGTEATASARQAASEGEVALLLDGRVDGWQEALDRIMPAGDTGAPS